MNPKPPDKAALAANASARLEVSMCDLADGTKGVVLTKVLPAVDLTGPQAQTVVIATKDVLALWNQLRRVFPVILFGKMDDSFEPV